MSLLKRSLQWLKSACLATLPALVLCFLLAEAVFRWVIPAAQWPYAVFDPVERVMRFDPEKASEGVFTIGRRARQRGHWRVNTAGWNSAVEYAAVRELGKPLVALIGDSYVEALQVDADKSVAADLRALSGGAFDVYSFGFSESPLSQYLQMSRYAVRRYRPVALVFVVVHNDLDESLAQLCPKPKFLQIRPEGTSFAEVPPSGYRPNRWKLVLRRSALVRYVWMNLGLILRAQPAGKFNANVDVEKVRENRILVERATDFLVGRIRAENPGRLVLFAMDAPRVDIYRGTLERSDVLWMNQAVREACDANGCEFLDLTPAFAEHYAKHGQIFNVPPDNHWNELGHRIAAEAIYGKLREMRKDNSEFGIRNSENGKKSE